MKKFTKIFALVLAVLMMGSVMIACNNGGNTEDTAVTEAAPAVSITVKVIVKDAEGKEVYNEDVKYSGANPTLGAVLEIFCAGNEFAEPFDANELLATLGDVAPASGETWIAYFENEGKNKAFSSIKNQVVADGQTVIVAIDKL